MDQDLRKEIRAVFINVQTRHTRQNKVTLKNGADGEVYKQNHEKQQYLNIKQLKQLKVDILGQTGNAAGLYFCMLYTQNIHCTTNQNILIVIPTLQEL